MQNIYHSSVINISQKTNEIINEYRIVDIKKRFFGFLKIYKIEIPENKINKAISTMQSNMSKKLGKQWYVSIYNSEIAIIVFKDKLFRASVKGVTPVYQELLDTTKAEDKKTWDELIEYGKALGIPDSQLDFLPPGFMDEKY